MRAQIIEEVPTDLREATKAVEERRGERKRRGAVYRLRPDQPAVRREFCCIGLAAVAYDVHRTSGLRPRPQQFGNARRAP